MSARLYLSYPNGDTQFAQRFAALLRKRGHVVTLFDDSLALGDRWRYYMDEALALADGLIVIITSRSLLEGTDRIASQWIAAEIGAARASANKFVIPIIFGTKGNTRVAIPVLVEDLFTRWFKRDELGAAVAAVTAAVATHLERKAKSAQLQLPSGYQHLAPNILRLHEDVRFDDAVFVMMKFPDPVRMDRWQIELLNDVWMTIKQKLKKHGLIALRADDRKYHDQLWENVCVYMLGCRFGIAVLEDRVASELNPNIALEFGFMRAMDRRVGLFRNVGFRHGRADLSGKLMNEFVVHNSGTLSKRSLIAALSQWLEDLGIAR